MLHSVTHTSILLKKIGTGDFKSECLLENDIIGPWWALIFTMEKTGQDIGRTSCRLNWNHHPKSEDQNKRVKIFMGLDLTIGLGFVLEVPLT